LHSKNQKQHNKEMIWKPELKYSMKEPNKFQNYETEKIASKASDAAEYSCLVLPPEIIMHKAFNVIL